MRQNDLIFDVGMHTGEDTAYYLHSGYRVVAVEANSRQVEKNTRKFQSYIDSGKLHIVNVAIWEEDDQPLDFHLSRVTAWCSFDKSVADRQNNFETTIRIKTAKLSTLFAKWGTPIYCKLDIENADRLALLSLREASVLPEFLSTETDCFGDDGQSPADQQDGSFHILQELGYLSFKLIDQITFKDMHVNHPLWRWKRSDFRYKITRKLTEILPTSFRNTLSRRLAYPFPQGSSGPWGGDTPGPWLNANEAQLSYKYHRDQHIQLEGTSPYGFWCDWHARLK